MLDRTRIACQVSGCLNFAVSKGYCPMHWHRVNRTDNRPENLELWLQNHPSGQRVGDVLAWAHEIIRRYDAEFVMGIAL